MTLNLGFQVSSRKFTKEKNHSISSCEYQQAMDNLARNWMFGHQTWTSVQQDWGNTCQTWGNKERNIGVTRMGNALRAAKPR